MSHQVKCRNVIVKNKEIKGEIKGEKKGSFFLPPFSDVFGWQPSRR
jgi:hypothetical protein